MLQQKLEFWNKIQCVNLFNVDIIYIFINVFVKEKLKIMLAEASRRVNSVEKRMSFLNIPRSEAKKTCIMTEAAINCNV